MNRRRRVALLTYRSPPAWVSGQSIVANLMRAYAIAFRGSDVRTFAFEPGIESHYSTCAAVARFAPDDLVFVDYRVQPLKVLGVLRRFFGSALRSRPRLSFHVYGGFVSIPGIWDRTQLLLDGMPVKFICGSVRQQRLVSSYLRDPACAVSAIPFPVDTETFRYRRPAAREYRRALGLRASQPLFLHSGRLTLERNVVRLCEIFLELRKKLPRGTTLALAGGFDDHGGAIFGSGMPEHHYLSRFVKQVWSRRGREGMIRFLGHLPESELARLYPAADASVSLALLHYEDYGMAVAESLCSGTRCLVPNWAGLGSFADLGLAVDRVGVRLDGGGLKVDEGAFREKVLELAHRFAGLGDRDPEKSGIARRSRRILSVEAVAAKLREAYFEEDYTEFAGFNARIKRSAQFSGGPNGMGEYGEVFRSYL